MYEDWNFCADGPGDKDLDGPYEKELFMDYGRKLAARDSDLLKVTPENCLHERVRTDEIKPIEGEAHAEVDGTCEVCGALMEGYADIQGADDHGGPQYCVDNDAWEVRT